ncbi:MAG: hypothetical protein JOZ19_03380, partial [Rubrobacter sp.]|nr:hypothetical protein [Rubrobacter sp.]
MPYPRLWVLLRRKVSEPESRLLGEPDALAFFAHLYHPAREDPMELHVVYHTPDGKIVVIGVLIKQGADNPSYAKLWSVLPEKGET